jgi:hypothetical protein
VDAALARESIGSRRRGAAAGGERRRLEWGWRESGARALRDFGWPDTGIEEAVSSLEGTRCFARRQCIHFSLVMNFLQASLFKAADSYSYLQGMVHAQCK